MSFHTAAAAAAAQDLKRHIANLNVSMTPDDAKNIQLQTQGARVAASVLMTPSPYRPIELATRVRRCALPVEVTHARTRFVI